MNRRCDNGWRGRRGVRLPGWGLAVLLCLPAVAGANLFNGSVNSVPQTVDSTRNTVLRVRWQMTFQNNGGPGTVYSNSGVAGLFDPNTQTCQVFQTVAGRVEKKVSTAQPPVTVTFDETVTVPAAAVVAARRQGLSYIDYCRRFLDDDGFNPGNILLVQRLYLQAGGLGGELGLNYVRLRFDDGSVSTVVPRGGRLGIRALVRHNGRGLVRAVWEVADPASTRGTPQYVVLGTVHRYLTGAGEEILTGPALPTHLPGLYLVRLRFLEPEVPASALVLRYFVQSTTATPQPLAPIAVSGPADGARLAPATRFRWAPVEGAGAYRIEFHRAKGGFGARPDRPADDSRPAAGLLVPGDAGEAAVSRLVRERLTPGTWFWRVVAFDGKGRRVAAGPFRRIIVGPARADGGGG